MDGANVNLRILRNLQTKVNKTTTLLTENSMFQIPYEEVVSRGDLSLCNIV